MISQVRGPGWHRAMRALLLQCRQSLQDRLLTILLHQEREWGFPSLECFGFNLTSCRPSNTIASITILLLLLG